MRIVPLIEVEIDCTAGSPVDYRSACGLPSSAVCTGALLELILVAGRELAPSPVRLRGLVLSGHAPIGEGIRLLGRGYEAALEVVGGSLSGTDWSGTHAYAELAPATDTLPAARRGAAALALPVHDGCVLEHVRARAGGLQAGLIVEARRDQAASRMALGIDSSQLDDVASYALHPLLWEAGVAVAQRLVAGPVQAVELERAVRVERMSLHAPGSAVYTIEATRLGGAASLRWLGADDLLVAEATGLTFSPLAVAEPGQRRCARVVYETLGKRVDDAAQPLVELGVSSIDRARVAAALALDFGCKPALEAIMACESLAQVARLFALAPAHEQAHEQLPASLGANARFVLSAAQRQVWALQAMAPDTPRCHVHMRLRCRGVLDERALRIALQCLLARHASLRVVIDTTGDEPLQRVLVDPSLAFEQHDVSELPEVERAAALTQHSDRHARARFDLERGPLVRFAWVKLARAEHALLISVHHLVLDGFGLELMVRELLALYENPDAFAGELFGLERIAELHVPESARTVAASGVFPTRDAARRLPLARDPTGSPSGLGGRAEVAGLAELTAPLRALAQREQVSLFSLLCAAYGYVLARHAGQDEIVIGVVSAARTTLDELGAVGMFARSVPLRVAIDEDHSLVALAHAISARVPHLVSEDNASPDASPFAVTALFQQWSMAPLRAGELSVQLELDSPDGAPVGYCRSELELLAADFGAELTACLQYDRSSLHSTTVEWLASAIGSLLARVCSEPARALRQTPLAIDGRAITLLGPALAIDEPCVHRTIAARAAATPSAIAVRDAFGAELSFEALAQRVNELARALRARGARAGRFVAVLAERTADLPVAVLAVLESGAAYVPIDPAHPAERVELALSDTGVELVIALSATERTFDSAVVVTLAELLEQSAAGPAAWEASKSSDAAYVLHTSGSTGKPKGVVVEHASLASFVRAMEALLPAAAREPWLALTTLAFDISIVELLFSLAIGAQTRVAAAPSLSSGEPRPFAMLRTLGLDARCFQCTPSLARLLLEDPDGRAFLEGLSVLLVGGESLPVWLARALCAAVPGAVFNVYGPTETTVWSSAARLRSDSAWVPIGQPIANTTLCVMDEAGCDVPPGLSGELWIGGAGVARGYLERPEETAARFVLRGGERFYRTGDLVRLRVLEAAESDAHALEWLGRIDRQIKLAGNRIELGEIEGVLTQHPFARECAVITERAGGEERLVAIVVPDIASMADASTGADAITGIFSDAQIDAVLRAWAEQKLPAYMLPARTLFVDSLPRTASGKTDRQALAELAARAQASVSVLGEQPVTREEKLLAQLWGEVLARGEIGRYDDFFALGGTSFAAVLLASRARKHGIALAPATVLAYPTLAAQALQISAVVVQREARALQAEVQLGELPAANGVAAWPPRRIVLTGATGFLGSHLLIELQASLDADVVCLIRARDDQAARERLEQSLTTWGLASRVHWDRIQCLAADLTLPRFGLEDEAWQRLAEHSDLVLHNAADVNFALGYEELRPANVGGTRTAIALAAEGQRKPLHYVSTIALTDAHEPGVRVDEDTPLPRAELLVDGYSQSKWVAEGIVRLAGEQGLNVTCYRAGPLVLDRAPKGDAFAEALATVARSGIAFATKGRIIPHLSRVDDTARAIVLLALDRTRYSQIEHVVSPQQLPVAELLSWIREWGFAVTELSDEEWLARIDAQAWAAATMFVVAQRLRDGIPLVPEVEHAATIVRLSARGFAWQEINGVLIQRLLARLTGSARAAEAS